MIRLLGLLVLVLSVPVSALGLGPVIVRLLPDPGGLPPDTYYQDRTLRYTGPLKEGVAEGEGRLFWDSGHLAYEGGFQSGWPEGKGVQYDVNGFRIYAGEFRRGQYHGAGTLYSKDAQFVLYEGVFENGQPNPRQVAARPSQ